MNILKAELTDEILDSLAEWLRRYFRVDVEGLEHVPAKGRALIAPNHSGFAAADAIMIAHLLHRERGRAPKILAHRAFFEWFELLRKASESLGLEKASVTNGVDCLERDELVLLFPEGEAGNFKPSTRMYHLQPFHTGFIQMALQASAPIVPCLVIGAEESHLNLGSVDLGWYLKGLSLPIPLNAVPLPAKWKIRFLPAVQPTLARTPRELCTELQFLMQRELNHELQRREYVYLPPISGET